MPKESTSSVPIEDRFFDFVTKDFPDFRVEIGARLTGLETSVAGAHSRLKRIETSPSIIPPLKVLKEDGNGAAIKGLFSRYKYWAVIALLAVGFWIGSRGDTEGTIRMLTDMAAVIEQIGSKVEQMEKAQTDPVIIPVPVSAEYYPEDAGS